MIERCGLTDLLPAECGCKNHRNSPGVLDPDPAHYRVRTFFNARFDGRCVLDTDHAITEGDSVAMLVDADDSSRTIGTACKPCVTQVLEVAAR